MSNRKKADKTSHHFRKYLRKRGLRLDPVAHREAHGCFGCYAAEIDWTREIELGAHGERENRASRRWHLNRAVKSRSKTERNSGIIPEEEKRWKI